MLHSKSIIQEGTLTLISFINISISFDGMGLRRIAIYVYVNIYTTRNETCWQLIGVRLNRFST